MLTSTFYCPHCGAVNQPQAAACFACGSALPADGDASAASSLGPSQPVLRGRYRVLARVGTGGFGAVYRAADTQLGDRLVAVKEMSQHGLAPEELREATEAFQREALLLAGLKHANLPGVHDQFVEQGRWYLVMEFIDGETLEDRLARCGGKLPLEEALRLGQGLCGALEYLHTRQPPIVFRDLKPSNVMLTPDGHFFLIDFGIARHFKPGQAKDTIAFGSPGYAAPEQYGKAQTTPRSDIFGLGALLHHLITGSDPSNTPFRFAPLPAGCPSALQRLLAQMVALDEQQRPASMAEVRQELARIAALPAGGQTGARTGSLVVLSASPSPATRSALSKTKEQWLADGDTHAAVGRDVPALSAYNEAIGLDHDYVDAYLHKSVVLHKLKLYKEMLAACKEAARCDPTNAGAHHNMGLALSKLRRHVEALGAFDEAIQCSPSLIQAYLNKGLALTTLKRYEEALGTFDQAILQVPDDSKTYMLKGDALARLKRYDEALLAYERASHLNPGRASEYARNKRWRKAQWKVQHTFSAPYARHLVFTFGLDLLLTVFLLWLQRMQPGSTFDAGNPPSVMSSPAWLLVGGVLMLLWSFIPRLLRLQTRQRRLAGVMVALISGLLSWLLAAAGFYAPAGIALLVAIKELLPAFLLLFSPRSLPRWFFPLLLLLSFTVSGGILGWLISNGAIFGMLLFGFAGLFMSFFVRISRIPV